MSDCNYCLFKDDCDTYYEYCDAFTPFEEDDIDEIIESGRYEYRKAFFDYMEEEEYFF